MIDYQKLEDIWDRMHQDCFSEEHKEFQVTLDMDKRDGNWWSENRKVEIPGNPDQLKGPGRQYSIMLDAKTQKTVCHLFGFGYSPKEDKDYLYQFAVEQGIKLDNLIAIGGLWVPPYSELPYHLDVIPLRWNWAKTYTLSGEDAEIALYVDDKKIFKIYGKHEFHLHPHYVVHGAITKSEPLKLLQFLLKEEHYE